MVEADCTSQLDRQEQVSLERTVADIERKLLSMPPGIRPFFNVLLENAKGRLGFLEKRIQEAERERQDQTRNDAVVAALVQKETALTATEKETYGSFLNQEFFTKRHFGKLEDFYARTWDRLSEGGKDKLSHRVWEGIRRDEYSFTELPKTVQEKEEDRAYAVLRNRGAGTAVRIPDADREDFIRAYDEGGPGEAAKVLERRSFRENMFLSAPSKERRAVEVTAAEEKIQHDVRESWGTSRPQPDRVREADGDLSELNLGELDAPKVASSSPAEPNNLSAFRETQSSRNR
jgi:hypothetical protein